MTDNDIASAIAALSARVNALEGAIHALVVGGRFDSARTLAAFDLFGQQMLDRYEGLPIDDQAIEFLEVSLRDVRELLTRHAV
jgi:hypothetical protein